MPTSFEIPRVADFLNTSMLRVNKLSEMCELKPSVRAGGKKGKRRHFSVQDVCRLGLALWLWKAGLRGPAVRDALRQPASKRLLSGLQTLKHIKAEAQRQRFLLALEFRGPHQGYRRVALLSSLARVRAALKGASAVVIPVGQLLESLAEHLESFAKF